MVYSVLYCLLIIYCLLKLDLFEMFSHKGNTRCPFVPTPPQSHTAHHTHISALCSCVSEACVRAWSVSQCGAASCWGSQSRFVKAFVRSSGPDVKGLYRKSTAPPPFPAAPLSNSLFIWVF